MKEIMENNSNGSFIYADRNSKEWLEGGYYSEGVVRFAPKDPDNSMALNWVPLCGNNACLALLLSKAIVTSNYKGVDDLFQIQAESNYLASLFAHASTLENPTPVAAYELMCAYTGEVLLEQLLNSANPIACHYAQIFANTSPNLRSSIVVAVGSKLAWLADEKVSRFTSSSTKESLDFGRLKRESIGVYWCLNESDLAVLKPLSALFFTLALHQLEEAEGERPVVLFVNDITDIPSPEVEKEMLEARNIRVIFGHTSIEELNTV